MKKYIFAVFVVVFCLLFFHIDVKGKALSSDTIQLSVGEKYIIPEYESDGIVIGSSVSIENGTVFAVNTGKSIVRYRDKQTKLKELSISVKKSGISVTMLDIGQGDAFVVQVNGLCIVIDTGEKKFYEYLKQQLDYLDIDKIDVLIISHMDTDHMGAAQLLAQEFGISKVMMPSTPGNSTEYYKFMNYLDHNDVETIYVHNNDEYRFGKGCTLSILGVDLGEDTNDSSIVMRFKYYKNTFLFTGDASASVLNKIMDAGQNIKADVLKIPHHGSDSSSPILFLKKTEAKYALISVGRDNSYGHPTENVIRRLDQLKTKVLRTDLDGTVTINGNGKKLTYYRKQVIDWSAEERLKVDSGSIIGNVNSKVYHNQDCLSLPMEKNRVYFSSTEDAEKAGYRKCGMCIK